MEESVCLSEQFIQGKIEITQAKLQFILRVCATDFPSTLPHAQWLRGRFQLASALIWTLQGQNMFACMWSVCVCVRVCVSLQISWNSPTLPAFSLLPWSVNWAGSDGCDRAVRCQTVTNDQGLFLILSLRRGFECVFLSNTWAQYKN